MIHREDVKSYPGTLNELAGELGDLRYDSLASFLEALAAKLEGDAQADEKRGRPQLASALQGAASAVGVAATEVEKAWKISAPFME